MPVNGRDPLRYAAPRVAPTQFCTSKERINTSRAGCAPLGDRIILGKHFTVYRLKKSALVSPEKNHLVDLQNKSIHEKYEQKFSLFLKPSLQRDKKFHPPLQATMPRCQATDLLWWIATETDVNKIINRITLLNTGCASGGEHRAAVRVKRDHPKCGAARF